jgi:hypothetical protein
MSGRFYFLRPHPTPTPHYLAMIGARLLKASRSTRELAAAGLQLNCAPILGLKTPILIS